MRHGSRHFRPAVAAAALTAGLFASPIAANAPAPANAAIVGVDVEITVTNLRNAKGVVWACMTGDPEAFPGCEDDPQSYRTSAPAEDLIDLQFSGVRPGTYAIALLHDENGNGKVDRALMVPREGFGFSRDAAVRMGPPHFDAAAFEVGQSPVHQTIRMRYLL